MVVSALVIKYFTITFLPGPWVDPGPHKHSASLLIINCQDQSCEVSDRKITKLPFTFSLEVNLLMKLRVIFVKVRNSRLEILSFHL